MQVEIDRLKKGPHVIEVNEDATEFPVLKDLIEQSAVSFETPVCGSLKITWVAGVVEVDGQLEAKVASACGRCLVSSSAQMVANFTLCYVENHVSSEGRDGDDVELTDDDLGLISYEGQEIDLRSDVEQEIIMALPQQEMCSPDCKGLCPVCGQNLNNKQCDCEPPVFHSGLAALKKLKIEE